MAFFLLDRNKLTVTLHRVKGCPKIPVKQGIDCGCDAATHPETQRLFCEQHFEVLKVKEQTEGRYWSLLLCKVCFPQ